MQALAEQIFKAFPPHSSVPPIDLNLLYRTFFNAELPNERSRWDEITLDDMNHGHFGGLLSVMGNASLAYWVPAWLTLSAQHAMAVPVALSSLASCLAPAFSMHIEGPHGVEGRVSLFNRDQKLAIAATGASLARNQAIIAFFQEDIGASMQKAWSEFAG